MDKFIFIGTLSQMKETENFHPFERITYPSGWASTNLALRCAYGNSNVVLRFSGGKWSDDSKNIIRTMKENPDEEQKKKYEKQDVAWGDRFNTDVIQSVPYFRRFIFDPVRASTKKNIKKIVSEFEQGDTNTELMNKYGIMDIDAAKTSLKNLNAKRKEFLTDYDFVEYLGTCVDWVKYAKAVFKITGTYESDYNAVSGKFYTKYHVTSVQRVEDDEPCCGQLTTKIFVERDSFDASDYEDKGCARINGWTSYYDSQAKANGFRPIAVNVYGDPMRIDRFKYLFDHIDWDIASATFISDIINGTQYREVTFDDLSDETKENIRCGITTFETQKQKIGRVATDTVSELRFVERPTDFEETPYQYSDMIPASGPVKTETNSDIDVITDDEDLFKDMEKERVVPDELD